MFNVVLRNTHKKGIHGLSVLLLFIATLLLAVIGSGLVLTNANKLAQEGTMAYHEGHNNYKAFHVIEVAGYDGKEQILTSLTIDVKLVGDSTPMDMHHLSVSVGEEDERTILRYRGDDAPIVNNHSGYKTWTVQEFGELNYTVVNLDLAANPIRNDVASILPYDVDGDGDANDRLWTCDGAGVSPCDLYDGTHVALQLTSTAQLFYAELRNQNGTLADISTTPEDLDVIQAAFTGDWGSLTVTGTVAFPYQIDNGCQATYYGNGELIEADLDDDGANDYMSINDTNVFFSLSNESDYLVFPLGTDLDVPGPIDTTIMVTNGERYGTLRIQGNTTQAGTIDEDVTVELTPYHDAGGYYVAEHLIRARNSRNGYLIPGDVVRFYVEAYDNITTDEVIDINFYYRNLDTVNKRVYAGNTFPNKEKVIMFPNP
ncbi:hypothetical protein GF367_02215 [Candidatus Woesearchaeota archaeon]|nr:hypothetical protein [Candidatus Woesearchaeota archaeon]